MLPIYNSSHLSLPLPQRFKLQFTASRGWRQLSKCDIRQDTVSINRIVIYFIVTEQLFCPVVWCKVDDHICLSNRYVFSFCRRRLDFNFLRALPVGALKGLPNLRVLWVSCEQCYSCPMCSPWDINVLRSNFALWKERTRVRGKGFYVMTYFKVSKRDWLFYFSDLGRNLLRVVFGEMLDGLSNLEVLYVLIFTILIVLSLW